MGWDKRFEALASAQARYIYLAAAAGVFYLALDKQITSGSMLDPSIQIPGVGIGIAATVVWLTAPAVLSFLVLASLGTIKALDVAAFHLGANKEGAFEPRDTAPNALDLAFYTTDRTPKFVRAFASLVYPGLFTMVFGEAVWFTAQQALTPSSVEPRWLFMTINALLTLAALPRLVELWWSKMRGSWNALAKQEQIPTVDEAIEILAAFELRAREAQRSVKTRNIQGRFELMVDGTVVAADSSLSVLAQKARRVAKANGWGIIPAGGARSHGG